MEKMTYTPDNYYIFSGFYESMLCNSDMFIDMESTDNCLYDFDDFNAYKNDVCNGITDLIKDMLVDDVICTSCTFQNLDSPREYNYRTDQLELDVEIDLNALKTMVLNDDAMRNGFDAYLKEKYTSYSGFMSFVENNVDAYFKESFDRYYDVLIDYYLLTKIFDAKDVVKSAKRNTDTPYWFDLVDLVYQCINDHAVKVDVA